MIKAGHLISNVPICGIIVKYTNLSVVNHVRQEVKTAAARQTFMRVKYDYEWLRKGMVM